MNFEIIFKQIAEDYCNNKIEDLKVAVKQKINELLKDKTNANALYNFFDINFNIKKQNKNAKQIVIKNAIKLVEYFCLYFSL